MQNEYNLQTFEIGYCKSDIMLSNFLTRALSSPSLLQESIIAMRHIYLITISKDHYNNITACHNLSALQYYLPKHAEKKRAKEQLE